MLSFPVVTITGAATAVVALSFLVLQLSKTKQKIKNMMFEYLKILYE
jgi:hypothetical protein